MPRTLHLALVLVALVAVGCQKPAPGTSEADSEKQLRATRDRVVDELGMLIPALEQALSASLRFSQGNYDSCAHTLERTTGFRYNINGRLDVFQGEASADAAARALEAEGWTVDTIEADRVSASKAGLDLTLSSLAGSTGDQAFLFTGGVDTCYVVGEERARGFSTDRDPLGAR